ncbi:hypothetical protein BU23DRAFT_554341 [Bimuria novae-zelandiae CBS 107.79]|uniref:Uncharacterized protein n=1 Tax=Bimuria novae-zelandiae CBS 107.79 TaxID=1447943 RepID=A0A6A5V7H2_9PLEO|nr:hypothetical protein BU23DRAFT_554341 [Bimuria novae-zelandiae CBS 107.79]
MYVEVCAHHIVTQGRLAPRNLQLPARLHKVPVCQRQTPQLQVVARTRRLQQVC